MKICNFRHDEIIHDETKCPLCEALDMIDDLKETISELEDEVEDLRNQS